MADYETIGRKRYQFCSAPHSGMFRIVDDMRQDSIICPFESFLYTAHDRFFIRMYLPDEYLPGGLGENPAGRLSRGRPSHSIRNKAVDGIRIHYKCVFIIGSNETHIRFSGKFNFSHGCNDRP
jgi:hypothetical protein